MGAIAALLAGPAWQPDRGARTRPWIATAPFLAVVLCACVASAWSLRSVPAAMVASRLLHDLPLAAASTLVCMVVALPAASSWPGLVWLLPAWLAGSVGLAGWSLVAVPQTALTRAVQAAVLLLPLMVAGLAGAASGMPPDLSRAAAASGAGPLLRSSMSARAVWPGTLRVMIVAFALDAALLVARI